VIPLRPVRVRPSSDCPFHKTLAERWDRINSWQEMYDAFKADDPDIKPFEEWMRENET
jgi:hypothetical protein